MIATVGWQFWILLLWPLLTIPSLALVWLFVKMRPEVQTFVAVLAVSLVPYLLWG